MQITKGEIVFQFVFDLAWEIRIPKLVKSEIPGKLGWNTIEDVGNSSRFSKFRSSRAIFRIKRSKMRKVLPERYKTADEFTAAFDDSGALALEYRLSFENLELTEIVTDSESFHENPDLLMQAREIAIELQNAVRKFLIRPRCDLQMTDDYEDYVIYKIGNKISQDEIEANKIAFASLIDGKREKLSNEPDEATSEYADDVLQYRLSHPRAGTTIANWSGAINIDSTWDGVIEIIRLANMELLELRLIAEQLTSQNDEFDNLTTSWHYTLRRPYLWFGKSMLSRVLRTKKEVKDQLGRIKNPLARFDSPNLAKIYERLKEIFLIDNYMEEIKDELDELKDSESTISERSSARRQDILALLGVLVAFEYITSGISNIFQHLMKFIL